MLGKDSNIGKLTNNYKSGSAIASELRKILTLNDLDGLAENLSFIGDFQWACFHMLLI